MSSLALDTPPYATALHCTADALVVTLQDGRVLSVPLAWFPRLARATPDQLAVFEWLGLGEGVHWPLLDEDLSIAGLLEGRPSIEHRTAPRA
jgi:hypothetical protein